MRASKSRIADLASARATGQLKIDELQGGTFTHSPTSGIYGSLMSTPFSDAPQSGILGMQKISGAADGRQRQDRGAAMMYLALSTTTASSTARSGDPSSSRKGARKTGCRLVANL